jgi:hypothetical protein
MGHSALLKYSIPCRDAVAKRPPLRGVLRVLPAHKNEKDGRPFGIVAD